MIDKIKDLLGLSKEEKKETKSTPRQKEVHNDFLKFLLFRFKDKKEHKQRRIEFSKQAIPLLLEGCGGPKNIVSIHAYSLAIRIKFKSHYQINEETIKKAGGVHLWIGEHELIEVFDRIEVKHIVPALKREVKRSRSSLIKLDIA